MALYKKKLHIRKNNTIESIHLYTERNDIDGTALVLRDGDLPLYAKLGEAGTSLRIRYGDRVLSVVAEATSTGQFTLQPMEWVCPYGVTKVKIEGISGSFVANVMGGKKYVFRFEVHERPGYDYGFIVEYFCNNAHIYTSPADSNVVLYYSPEINKLVATKTL